jgi:hypothetical protein
MTFASVFTDSRNSESFETLVQLTHPSVEIGWILCVRAAFRCLQLGNVTFLPVVLDELLDPLAADPELLSNQFGVHAMINNSLTDQGNLLLVKLHLVGGIMSTKTWASNTD